MADEAQAHALTSVTRQRGYPPRGTSLATWSGPKDVLGNQSDWLADAGAHAQIASREVPASEGIPRPVTHENRIIPASPVSIPNPNPILINWDPIAAKSGSPAAASATAGSASQSLPMGPASVSGTISAQSQAIRPDSAAPSAQAGPASGSSQIRPLSLTPQDVASAPVNRSVTNRSRIAPMDASGGGDFVIPSVTYQGSAGATITNTDPDTGMNEYDTAATDVIGGLAIVSVNITGVSSYQFTVSGDTYSDVYTNGNHSGFYTTDYTGASGTATTGGGVTNFYWDQFAGTRTITIDVTYTNGDTGEAEFTVNVQGVSGSLTPSVNNQPGIIQETPGNWWLSSTDYSNPANLNAITWTGSATAPYVSGGGYLATCQTITALSATRAWTTGNWYVGYTTHRQDQGVDDSGATPTYPRPLLDDYQDSSWAYGSWSTSNWQPYGTINSAGVTTTTVSDGDSPEVKLLSGYDSYSYIASFKDTLMYRPSGGIWVPLGSYTWNISMGAGANSSKPSGYSISYTATSAGGYSSSTDYPDWVESFYYLASTYGTNGWVDTAP